MFFVFRTICLQHSLCLREGFDVRGCVCSYGNASRRTGQVTTSPVQAMTRPLAGEDIVGGTRGTVPVRHDIATVLIMQRLVLDASKCYVFSCPVKTRWFLLPSPLQLYRVCKSQPVP